jgi:O-antigen ligase
VTGPLAAGDPAPAAASRADRVLVAATATFLFFAPAAASTGWRLIALSIAGFAILAAGWSRLRGDFARLPALPLFAFAAWAAVSAASWFWSEAPHYSAREIKTEILYGTMAFAVFAVAGLRVGRWPLWRAVLLGATAITFLGDIVLEHLPWRLMRHSLDGGAGPWSTHLVLVAPLLLMIRWPRPWGDGRRAGWAIAALALLALAAWRSENRIVWAALGVQLGIATMLMGADPDMRTRAFSRFRAGLLAAVLVVVIAFAGSIAERNERLFHEETAAASLERDLRPRLWRAAWQEIREAPWLGHGFGREISGTRFLALAPRGMAHPPMLHSHNVFADVAVQTGLVGLAAFMVLLLALAREHVRWLRDARVAPLGIVGLTLLAGFIVKNLTDDFLHRHNALVWWALNAMLLGLAARARRQPGGG